MAMVEALIVPSCRRVDDMQIGSLVYLTQFGERGTEGNSFSVLL